ncbi:MAG: hypothetical protein ACKVS8_07205 [Phycisphaerales bacterium]
MTGNPADIFKAEELSAQDKRLLEEYERVGRSVDDLAYTAEFDALCDQLKAMGDSRSKAELFRRLLTFRKAGRLPRIA